MRYIKPGSEGHKVKLDIKDKRILSMLASNARLTATSISKKVGLSRDAVIYRMKNLEESGAIQGYKTIVNINKFGYDSYHLFLQLSQPTVENEKKLIAKLQSNKYVRAILKFSGKYDFELALVAKNIREFDKILNDVLSDCSDYLNDYEVLAITKNYVQRTFPKTFYDKEEKEELKKQDDASQAAIDLTDENILKAMTNDASATLQSISKKSAISSDSVNYRVKNMIKNGIISKFTIALNYAGISYDVYAVLLNMPNLPESKEKKLKELLLTDENIIWAVKTIGKYNILMYVCTDKPEKLHQTMIRLRTHFPKDIKNYETMIAYEEYKYTYFPENLELL